MSFDAFLSDTRNGFLRSLVLPGRAPNSKNAVEPWPLYKLCAFEAWESGYAKQAPPNLLWPYSVL